MKKIICFILTVILFILGRTLLQGDYAAFLQWWVTILYIGIIFMPLTTRIFGGFHDKGYLFSKAIGVAVIGYLMWLLSSIHLLRFTSASSIICVIISLAANVFIVIYVSRRYNKENPHRKSRGIAGFILEDKTFDTIFAEELLFFAVFLLFTYIRGFKPDVWGSGGTEKFMDYGFMTSMMRSEYMPPQDFWFSGTSLNYYYVGQYFAAFLTKLSGVSVRVAYNLMLMMVGTFAVVLPYSLVYNVISRFMRQSGKKGRLAPHLSGAVSAIAVCIAGNMHYPTFKWFEPLVRKFFGMEAGDSRYWFPDATRFIGYHPENNDKTIHEFPAYSFVLGDLHAHVINIMFVLTVAAVLYAWSCSRRDGKADRIPDWKEVVNPAILMISFFIGLFHTTNYWDFPIYYVVSGAVILFTNLVVYNFKGRVVTLVTAAQGAFVLILSTVIALPFTLKFDQISTNICLTVARTALNQLVILWGLPIFMVIAFLSFLVSDYCKEKKRGQETAPGKKTNIFAGLLQYFTVSDLFIITLGLCAIGLIIIPEVIYVEDIYSGDFKRANTMFKLTYQAFILFGLCFGYIFMRLLWFGRTARQKVTAAIGLIFFAMSVCYIQNAVNAWYGNIFRIDSYKGLDVTGKLREDLPDDMLAIDWLNDNVEGMPVVLEAPGDSYTDYERVSAMTGLPTVLGWRTHEWLWKSDTAILDARAADIERIYTSDNITEVKELLAKYEISYIYVGKLEQEKYAVLNHDLIKSLGDTVFVSPESGTKEYETYIIELRTN